MWGGVEPTWQLEEQHFLQTRIVPHARTLRKAREQIKWMVKDGISSRRIISYLHRWCMWWVRTVVNWHYQDLLLWFLDTCWDLDAATFATALLHRGTVKSIKREKPEVGYRAQLPKV